jgi:hypothetical protein
MRKPNTSLSGTKEAPSSLIARSAAHCDRLPPLDRTTGSEAPNNLQHWMSEQPGKTKPCNTDLSLSRKRRNS